MLEENKTNGRLLTFVNITQNKVFVRDEVNPQMFDNGFYQCQHIT